MREYFLNADFDLTLRGGTSLLETSDATFVHEMAWHFLFAGGKEDSVVLYQPLPPEFLAYLGGKALALPHMSLHPGHTPSAEFTPFGWNAFTEARRSLYVGQPPYPSLAAVKTANSRAFSHALERSWAEADGVPWRRSEHGDLFQSWSVLEKFLLENPRPGAWFAKGDHGHAGTGNRRISERSINGEEQKVVQRLLADHGQVVLEPWQDRIMDMSANFTVEPGGRVKDFCGHELHNSQDGAFLGVKIFPNRRPPAPWDARLESAAAKLGKALDGIGYFGPVSMDAYVWQSPAGPQLRSLVDVNARYSMALPAHGLASRLPGKLLLWTWTKPRKLSLPADYVELDARLGQWAFSSATQTGILAASPIWHAFEKGKENGKAKRVGFLFSANNEEEFTAMRQAFASVLGRK